MLKVLLIRHAQVSSIGRQVARGLRRGAHAPPRNAALPRNSRTLDLLVPGSMHPPAIACSAR